MPSPVQMSALVLGSNALPTPPEARNDGLCRNRLELAREHLHGDDALALPVLDDEVRDEPLFIGANARLHDLFVHDVQDGLTGDVRHEEGTGVACATECPRPKAAFLIAVEDHAHVLQRDDLAGRFLAHELDGVLVAQVIGAFYGIEYVRVDGVFGASEGSIDTALSSIGVAADGMHLAHHRHIGAGAMCRDSSSHARKARPDNQNVVVSHRFLATCDWDVTAARSVSLLLLFRILSEAG